MDITDLFVDPFCVTAICYLNAYFRNIEPQNPVIGKFHIGQVVWDFEAQKL